MRPEVGRSRGPFKLLALAAATMAATVSLGAAPAAANWQYTRWGMAPDEVVKASGGAAVANADRKRDAEGEVAKLTAPYQGAAIPFTAVFLFNELDQLAYVTLEPVGGISCPVIREALDANHGPPERSEKMEHATTTRWEDYDNNNLIVFLDLGNGDCTIQYSRLPRTRSEQRSL